MRDNVRWKERFELALDAKQIIAVLVGSLVILGGAFVLGMSVGRHSAASSPQPIAAPKDPLAHLDEPLAKGDEPAPELKAHQALTDARSIDKTLPVAASPSAPPLVVTPPAVGAVPAPSTAALPDRAAAPEPPAPSASGAVASPALDAGPTVAIAPPAPLPPKATSPARPTAGTRHAGTKPAASAQHGITAKASAGTRQASAKSQRPGHAAAAASKGSAYTIQVGAASKKVDAERLAKRLASRHPRVVTADVPGKGRVYRVQIGRFETRDAARRQLASLSGAGVNAIVVAAR